MNPQLYLVNDKIAAAACFPEIFDTMAKLFGGNERCLKLYQVSYLLSGRRKRFIEYGICSPAVLAELCD